MSEGLCSGLRRLDRADDPGARAARILGDVDAEVTLGRISTADAIRNCFWKACPIRA